MCSAILEYNTFQNNVAKQQGGAIVTFADATLTISSSRFIDNGLFSCFPPPQACPAPSACLCIASVASHSSDHIAKQEDVAHCDSHAALADLQRWSGPVKRANSFQATWTYWLGGHCNSA